MALFGAPSRVGGSCPFAPVLAALDIQTRDDPIGRAKAERLDGIELRLRIGLNSGQVIAGEIDSGPRRLHRDRRSGRHGPTDGIGGTIWAGSCSANPPPIWSATPPSSASPKPSTSRAPMRPVTGYRFVGHWRSRAPPSPTTPRWVGRNWELTALTKHPRSGHQRGRGPRWSVWSGPPGNR